MKFSYRVWAVLSIFFLSLSSAIAEQIITSFNVSHAPVVDGYASDRAWAKAREFKTHDPIANIDINIKTVYTKEKIYFLVRFPDASHNHAHKALIWNESSNLYKVGPLREDTFVFKWNMEPYPVDISLGSDNVYKADVWYWKSFRTNHSGYADDKYHIYSDIMLAKGHKVYSKSGKGFYLLRKGDKGQAAYSNSIPIKYQGDRISGYKLQKPEGSRADVMAKGRWKDGIWTIEFSRKLNTQHIDDIHLEPGNNYYFGVSRYEIAGRLENSSIEIPLYGAGDVGENLILKFKSR